MDKLIDIAGNAAGVVGIISCVLSGLVRVSGAHQFYDISAGLIFEMGVGLMVFACLAKLHLNKVPG